MNRPPSDHRSDPALLQAHALARPAMPGAPLSFTIRPGLNWILGDEGSGKTWLLQCLAGRLAPAAGHLVGERQDIFLSDALNAEFDAIPGEQWLLTLRERHPGWTPSALASAVEALELTPHVGKPLYQLSAGTRRKLGLAAAFASGARLTLLDQPFAALDARSQHALVDLLRAEHRRGLRGWVVADYERPDDLALGPTITLTAG